MKLDFKNWLTIIFLAIGIGALYFILKAHGLSEIFQTYRNFDNLTLTLYALSLIALFVVLTWRWDVILKSRNIKVPFQKLFIYRIIGTSINFLTPGPRVGGEPTQASLLTKHKVDFTEGLSTIMIDKIVDVTTSGILFLIGILLVGLKYSITQDAEISMLIAAVLFVAIIILFYYRMLRSKHFFLKIFHILRLDRIKNKFLINA